MKKAIASVLLLCLFASVAAASEPAAQALIDGGHWKWLRAMAAPRVAANPNDAEAAYLLGYAKAFLGDLDGGLALAEKALALNGQNADYHFLVGRICGQKAENAGIFKGLGLARRFKKEAEIAISLNPNHIEALTDLMEFYFEAPGIAGGDKKKAYALADQIGKINAARGFLAQATLAGKEKEKDPAKFESLFRKAVEADPRYYGAHMALANILATDTCKKYDESEKLAREAIKIDPGRPSAYAMLVTLFVLKDRWQDLDAVLAESEKNLPDNLYPYFQAGRMLLNLGKDLPRAERYFRKYLSQEAEGNYPHHANTHWRLGQVLEKQGRKPEAISEMQTALKLEPEFEPARKDLKRLN
jgi:tetratricopeptide (TPR) repeat protein